MREQLVLYQACVVQHVMDQLVFAWEAFHAGVLPRAVAAFPEAVAVAPRELLHVHLPA